MTNLSSPYFRAVKKPEIATAVSELRSLVQNSTSEEEVQQFLAKHIYFLLLTPVYDHFLAVAKPEFGSMGLADFGLYGSCNGPWWTFVELEKPNDSLFTRAGDPTARLTHAMRQTQDWRRWISENTDHFESVFGNDMGDRRTNIVTGIIIGRRSQLDRETRARLQQISRRDYDWIMTYDGLLERADQMLFLEEGSMIHQEAYSFADFYRIRRKEGFKSFPHRCEHALRAAVWAQDSAHETRKQKNDG